MLNPALKNASVNLAVTRWRNSLQPCLLSFLALYSLWMSKMQKPPSTTMIKPVPTHDSPWTIFSSEVGTVIKPISKLLWTATKVLLIAPLMRLTTDPFSNIVRIFPWASVAWLLLKPCLQKDAKASQLAVQEQWPMCPSLILALANTNLVEFRSCIFLP